VYGDKCTIIFFALTKCLFGSIRSRDGHGLVLEENRIEPNQTVFKIYITESNCLSLKPNRTIKVIQLYGFKPNIIIFSLIVKKKKTNFSLKKTELLKRIEPNQTINHEPNRNVSV
jgi:hypothetical protein